MIIKWAGGKKWLFPICGSSVVQGEINNYIEPFFGGGSFFFEIRAKESVQGNLPAKVTKGHLSDVNPRLIKALKELKKNPSELYKKAKALFDSHTENNYYKIRDEFNKDNEPYKFFYLNKTCFNGIYRENQKGEFNVPAGKDQKSFPSEEVFLEHSKYLQNFSLKCCDFEKTLDNAEKEDFIFLDPPYVDRDDYDSDSYKTFRKYNAEEFSDKDLKRMSIKANELSSKCKILITNHFTPYVQKLFLQKDGWNHYQKEKTTFISGKPKGRVKAKEIIISNFPIQKLEEK
tara:strand:+ start:5634 stop:6497 length:864 start_codon:yes stop_codon:yes gene_type:complete